MTLDEYIAQTGSPEELAELLCTLAPCLPKADIAKLLPLVWLTYDESYLLYVAQSGVQIVLQREHPLLPASFTVLDAPNIKMTYCTFTTTRVTKLPAFLADNPEWALSKSNELLDGTPVWTVIYDPEDTRDA